jgi:hypothetical protein
MIGKGYYKDFYTQEYLEELVRLTYPNKKVNNIVPFIKYLANDNLLIDGSIFFCKVHLCVSAWDNANHVILTQGAFSLNATANTDFILFDSAHANTSACLVGYKITLDDAVADIYAGSTPPPVSHIGRIYNPVVYVSNDANNTVGEPVFYIGVNTEGEADRFFAIDSYSGTALNGKVFLNRSSDTGNYNRIDLIGSDFPDNTYNTIQVFTDGFDIRPFSLRSYNDATDRLYIDIATPCTLLIRALDDANTVLFNDTASFGVGLNQEYFVDITDPITQFWISVTEPDEPPFAWKFHLPL